MEPSVYLLYLSHLLYGICVNIFIMNRYISKSYTTSKNTFDRQYTEWGQLQCQLLLVVCQKPLYGQEAEQQILKFETASQSGKLEVLNLCGKDYLFIKHGLMLIDSDTQGQLWYHSLKPTGRESKNKFSSTVGRCVLSGFFYSTFEVCFPTELTCFLGADFLSRSLNKYLPLN